MPNPLVAQGVLNRLRSSITWANFANLNVTAPYLGEEGIKLTFEGQATQYFKTMTGSVTSPEPYLEFNMVVNLLKTQPLGNLYKTQMETLSTIGDGTVRCDATAMLPWQIINCSIQGVEPLDFSGRNPLYAVRISGYYLTNSSLFSF